MAYINIKQEMLKILFSIVQDTEQTLLQKWMNECLTLLSRAKILEKEYVKLKQLQVTPDIAQIQNLQEKHTNLKTDKLIQDMYVFLNQVGETLRQETIMYQVTLSTGKGKTEQITTFEMSMQEFLTVTSSSKTRLTLAKVKTILNKLQNNNNIRQHEWTAQEIFDYQRFIYNAKRVQYGRWKNVNRGNLLEAFSRYQDLRKAGKSVGSTTVSMQQTLTNTQGFWQGADYNGFQIKGNYASVTNIYTCVNQINLLYDTLKSLDFNGEKLKEKNNLINNIVNEKLEDYIDDSVDELLSKLQKQFGIEK